MRPSTRRTAVLDGTRKKPARSPALLGAAGLVVTMLFGAGCGGGLQLVPGHMPDGGTFTGVYHSPQYGDMNLIQNGSAVVGEYKQEMRSGKIQGEADGDLLRFEWVEEKAMVSNRPQETRGHGYFRYKIDKGNGDHVLVGEWGLGDEMTGGGSWNAYKSKGKEPHLSTETSGGENTGSDDESSSEHDTESSGGGKSSGNDSSGDDLF